MISKRSVLYGTFGLLDRVPFLKGALRARHTASVLMFHRVNDYDSDPLTTPMATFREMMSTIRSRYEVRSLMDLVGHTRDRRPLDGPTVVITFDDGYKDNILHAAPILKEFDVSATFFVTSGYIGTEKRFPWDAQNPGPNVLMSWDEVRELDRMGFEIGAHTVTHADMGAVTLDEARREIRESKRHIESELGKPVLSFAFPFGRRENCNPEVSRITREEGFLCCCNGFGGKVTEHSDPFSLDRIPAYPTLIETRMEIENFATYYDGRTRVAGIPIP